MGEINLNIINTLTFIKTTFKNIFLNKRHVNSSSFRDQLSINSKNINQQTNNSYVNKQNSCARFNLDHIDSIIYIKQYLRKS